MIILAVIRLRRKRKSELQRKEKKKSRFWIRKYSRNGRAWKFSHFSFAGIAKVTVLIRSPGSRDSFFSDPGGLNYCMRTRFNIITLDTLVKLKVRLVLLTNKYA